MRFLRLDMECNGRIHIKVLLKLITGLVLIYGITFLSGCPGDKIIPTVKVNSKPNTFGLGEKRWGGNVVFIKVWDPHISPRKVVWHIEATRDIPIRDFVVTVGKVPPGFKQVVPSSTEEFVPVIGKEYEIGIWCDFKPHAFPLETIWIAE